MKALVALRGPMRVLVPVDGSEETYTALERGLGQLREVPGLEVTLLNVRQEGFEAANDPQYIEETYEADEDDEVFPSEAASQRALERAEAIASAAGLEVASRLEKGNYRKIILELAAEHDVLLMHGLRKSNLKDALKGSATEKLARQAPCTVMLVRTE